MSEREAGDAAQRQFAKERDDRGRRRENLSAVNRFMLDAIEYVRCHRACVRGEAW